jgi:fluoride exporter
MLRSIFFACVGGALGTGFRVAITTLVVGRFGAGFPYATMGINIVGCFLIGFIAELARTRSGFHPEMRTFLVAGVLGGFTTFSAFSYDVLNLFGNRDVTLTLLYVVGSVAIGIVAAHSGVSLVRAMAR